MDEWVRLGLESQMAGKFPDAERHYRRALRLVPCHPTATHNLAILFAQTERLNEALLAMERAMLFDGVEPLIASNMALMNLDADRVDEALVAAEKAMKLSPDKPADLTSNPLKAAGYLGARLSYAMISASSGYPAKALPVYNEMLELDPKHPAAGPNSCFVTSLMPLAPQELLAQRRKWHVANHWQGRFWPHKNDKNPDRVLRVGYVGGDFKSHSAAMMFAQVLLNHDPAKVQAYYYCSLPVDPTRDDLTQMFMRAAGVQSEETDDGAKFHPDPTKDHWRDVCGKPDEVVEDLIGKDEIDILVDLAAHTNGGRLGVFTRRPAPVQITAWGFAHGTALPEIDVFFADPVAVPHEERQYYAERIIDLPSIVTYRPPVEYALKPSTSLPFYRNEYFTFGSFSRFEKLSDECLACFAEILRRVPDSRLFLKDHAYRRPYSIRRVLNHLSGIDKNRIQFGISTSHVEHLATYQDVDLSLDTWPHGAGVVSLECLYMGVPMLTRWGTQAAGRTASSVLTAMGRTDWITKTPEEYIEKAVELAGRPQDLAKARKTLRQELLDSPVIAGYPQAVEAAYRALWKEWVQK